MDAGNGGDDSGQAQGGKGGEGQVLHSISPSFGRARCPALMDEEMDLHGRIIMLHPGSRFMRCEA